MTKEQVKNLIKYGDSINILVTPVMIDGVPGVHYCDVATNKADVANRDLLYYSLQISCAA